MKIFELFEPRSHVIIDNFLDKLCLENFFTSTLKLKETMKTGLQVYRDGHGQEKLVITKDKRNKTSIIRHSSNNQQNNLLAEFSKKLLDPKIISKLEHANNPIYQLIKFCDPTALQVSAYGDGDYYNYHTDIPPKDTKSVFINLTVLFMICKEPKKFSGGNFVLSHRSQKKVILFKNNRLLIFPCNTLHKVTPVQLKFQDFSNYRFTFQFWPKITRTNI